MSRECEFCGRHVSMCGELRMGADPQRGGALYPICHDCHDDGQCDESCAWLSLATLDEINEDRALWHLPMLALPVSPITA